MRRNQAGITFIGWVVLLIPIAIIVYCAIRLIPIYLNHMKVASSIEQVAAEARGDTVSPAAIKSAISRRFDIESVYHPTMDDVSVTREGEGWVIQASYERTAPLFGGIDLLVTFDKRVPIQ
jgi:hypothetical protein